MTCSPGVASARDADELLAEVLALQEADEGLRRALETLGDVLAIFELAVPHPGRHLAQDLGLALRVIGDDEALHQQAPRQHDPHIWAGRRLSRAVMCDEPADRHAREVVEQRPDRLLHLPADIL